VVENYIGDTNERNFITLAQLVRINEHKIASYLKMKKGDRLLESSAYWDGIQLETFFNVRPEPGS